ncbi:glycoside hydrolase family 16 protein [Sphingobacterium spiritivorum]|uniref:glycoside hydrolase family 16 protein n=1 Tax=Sphingobacterium spiritivorum TaxID=258 RepID=UPI001919CE6C|nr:glycoside hydrolase family 16 protein [Sphingobacterium spiritivorum]QQT25306.1 glycoside hydrolase family 16 protein [Sphingobacterium spiritivorum]
MKWYSLKFSALAFVVFLVNCGGSSVEVDKPVVPTDRVISFSGMDWIVRTTNNKTEGPGPNRFSDSDKNVWVDGTNRLHLKIRQEGGNWYCAGVTAKKSMGYGKYIFYIGSDVNQLDKNVVAGLFTYLNDEEEIDIEFSKWSVADNVNAQFVSQPSTIAGNKVRFDIVPDLGQTVHFFDWQEKHIAFASSYTDSKGLSQPIHEWTYTGKQIPKEKNEKLKLNLWLFRGQMPSDLKEQEIVIDSVRFVKQ